jgi:hypothetical protein
MADIDYRLLKKEEVKNRIQYWYSKYCNGIMRDERKIYLNLYKSYVELNDYYEYNHKYVEE